MSASLIDRRRSRGSRHTRSSRSDRQKLYRIDKSSQTQCHTTKLLIYYTYRIGYIPFVIADVPTATRSLSSGFGSLILLQYTRKYFKRSRLIGGGLSCDFRVHVCAINNNNDYYDIRSAGSARASSVYSALSFVATRDTRFSES